MMPNCPYTTRKSNFSLVRSFLVLRLSLLTTSNAQYPRLYLDLMIEKLKITLKTTFQILSNTFIRYIIIVFKCIFVCVSKTHYHVHVPLVLENLYRLLKTHLQALCYFDIGNSKID